MAITVDDYAVQVELAMVSNVAKDSIVNTFAVKALSGSAEYSDINGQVEAFFGRISAHIGPTVQGSGVPHRTRVYHLSDPEPRPPVYTGSFSRNGSGTALPAEVAVCTSMAAESPAGARPARRRGRMYIGPLNSGVVQVVAGYARPSATFQTLLANSTETFVENLAELDWQVCIWSRKDDTLFPVVRGWVNDEFDTQRRRGPEVTTRAVWPS